MSPNPSATALPARTQRSITIGYFAAFTSLGGAVAIIGPTLPSLAAQTGTLLSQISFLFSARALGFMLGALFGGKFYDRLPGHPVIVAGLILMAISLVAMPVAPLFWLLLGFALSLGLAEAIIDVGTNTLLPWMVPGRVAPYMNALHFFFGAGAFLAPIVVAQVTLLTGGYRASYWLMSVFVFLAAIWIVRLKSPTPHKSHHEEHTQPQNFWLIGLIVAFLFLYVGVETAFGGWVYTYAVTLELTTITVAAYLTSAFWGALTAGRLLSIPLASRVRPRWLIAGALGGSLGSLGVVLLAPASMAALWVGAVGLGLSMAPIFPTTLSLAERNMKMSGQVTGWFFAGGSLGGMFVPVSMGQLIERVGPVSMVAAMFGLMATAVFVYVLLLYAIGRYGMIQPD